VQELEAAQAEGPQLVVWMTRSSTKKPRVFTRNPDYPRHVCAVQLVAERLHAAIYDVTVGKTKEIDLWEGQRTSPIQLTRNQMKLTMIGVTCLMEKMKKEKGVDAIKPDYALLSRDCRYHYHLSSVAEESLSLSRLSLSLFIFGSKGGSLFWV
jgi:hypothetical protein